MENITNNLIEALNYINKTGINVPFTVTQTTATNNTQFMITILITAISSLFVFIWLWQGMARPIVAQMIVKFKLHKMKKESGRHVLFIKHTQQGMFGGSMITQKTLLDIYKAFDKFKGKPFDLVLHTPGGEVFSSLFISRMIRNYPATVRVMIPFYAMSGGTLLALSGSEIHMSPNACLGPVDPQLGNLFKYGSSKSWNHILKLKGAKAEDQSISFAMMGQQYTKTIAKYIDSLVLDKMEPKLRKEFVNILTSGDIEHAYPLLLSDLRLLGMPVKQLLPGMSNILNKVITSDLYEGVYYI